MEWEGVRHTFHPDKVWSSRLLWPMYPFYAWDEWYVVHVKQTKSHKFIYECILFFVFKKNSNLLLWVEKNWIWFIKNQICFWELKKKKKVVLLMKEKSNMFLQNKIFWFEKKNIRSVFENLEKMILVL